MKIDNFTITQILNFISKYLKSSENIITDIYRVDSYNDYPFFPQYATSYLPRNGRYEMDLIANGISLDKKTACMKAIMETIERWYLSYYDKSKLIFDSYAQLRKKFINIVNPISLIAVSRKQLSLKQYSKFRFKENSRFYWTQVNKLFKKEIFYMPAQLIYFMNDKKIHQPTLRLADSSGAAAGTSIEQALYNGICELIERDAYAIMYYNKLPVKKINTEKIPNQKIRALIDYLNRYYFEIIIFDITLDIKIPIFFSVLIDHSGIGPKISVGAKCDLSWKEALYGSILESLQAINSLRDIMIFKKSLSKRKFNRIFTPNRSTLNRSLYWGRSSSTSSLEFILSLPPQPLQFKDKITNKQYSYTEKLTMLINKLQEIGITDIYWKRVTPSTLDKFNLYATKVIIPQLQALSLDEQYVYFGGKRLYNTPVRLGLRKNPLEEEELNTTPHPLP